jgi:heme/copper-type cytochrome/quinol oxidase subunit 1
LSVDKNKLMYYNYINYYINQNNCYILIIPAFGIVSQIVSTFSGKPIFGYIGMVYAMFSIGILGWASVRMFIELIKKIRKSRLTRRVRSSSYIKVNNLIVCENRETIACYVKRMDEEDLATEFQYSKRTFRLKNYPWLTLIL